MKRSSTKTVLIAWALVNVLMLLSFWIFPHEEINKSSVASNSIQVLLFILSVALFKREPNRQNKFLFLNFALLFSLFIFFHLYNFVPASSGFLRFYLFQYVGVATYYSLLTFALVYLTIDLLFRNFGTARKYLLSGFIVFTLFVTYFHPFLTNPMHIYSTPDAQDFSIVEESFVSYKNQWGRIPTEDEFAEHFTADGLKQGFSVAEVNVVSERTRELYPYLVSEDNYAILLIRPLYQNIVYMCVAGLFFILLFFGYQYYKDPPQGAYIEKIMSLFFVFLSVEILHAWSFLKSVHWTTFYSIVESGQIISACILILISGVFFLRLKFITSPNGEFYEQEIATSPKGITRWRDMFDELILTHFINNSSHPKGTLFVDKTKVT